MVGRGRGLATCRDQVWLVGATSHHLPLPMTATSGITALVMGSYDNAFLGKVKGRACCVIADDSPELSAGGRRALHSLATIPVAGISIETKK